MGKFKDYYLTNESTTMSDLGPRLHAAVADRGLDDQINGVLTHQGWIDNSPPPRSENDIGVPTVDRTAKITHLMLKKNPIYVRLSDGTECNFSYDEFRKIHGKPEIGKTMSISFQRHPGDMAEMHSKIERAVVLN